MNRRDQIIRAHAYAAAAHLGQYDRDSRPHMDHVERVVSGVRRWLTEPEMSHGSGYYVMPGKLRTAETIAAAWLHDVVEDTPTTCEYLAHVGFSPDVVAMVAGLTRPEEPSYMEYVQSIAELPGALGDGCLVVKLADLEHNLERSLAEGSTVVRRYERALLIVRPELERRGYRLDSRHPDFHRTGGRMSA